MRQNGIFDYKKQTDNESVPVTETITDKDGKPEKDEKSEKNGLPVNVVFDTGDAGIPQIATAGNPIKKIIRAVVFVACLAGFIYQSLVFMNLYWEYKTVLDVQVLNTKEAELPAVTICNFNGLYSSKICKDPRFEKNCSVLENLKEYGIDWCECFPGRYCKNGILGNYTTPSYNLNKILGRMAAEEWKDYLQPLEEFITGCTLDKALADNARKSCDLSYVQQIRCPSDAPFVSGCFTINTLVGRPDAEPDTVLSSGRVVVSLDPVIDEYPSEIGFITVQMAIHDPRQIVNPFVDGFTLQLDTTTSFRLKKTVKNLLPAPYETDCVDYKSMWRARGGYGPLNQKDCILECEKNVSLENYGCISQQFFAPSNEKRCAAKGIKPDVLRQVHECQDKYCKPACYEEIYHAVRDSRARYDEVDCTTNDDLKSWKKTIGFNLILDGMETTTYTYSPKYQNIETFSYLGGYVGMWLGISLVALFDFLETVVIVMRYPFRKYMESQAKKEKLSRIKKLQRDM